MLIPALTIIKTANVSTTDAGRRWCSYTITVTDTGQTPYTGAAVTDHLAGVLDDATYNGDAAATAGTVSFASPDADLDRGPGGRGHRDDHLLGHREQPRHRRQD